MCASAIQEDQVARASCPLFVHTHVCGLGSIVFKWAPLQAIIGRSVIGAARRPGVAPGAVIPLLVISGLADLAHMQHWIPGELSLGHAGRS